MSLNTGTDLPLDSKDLDDLLEEFVARIVRLALFVPRVVAVLADNDDAIHREFAGAARQRFGDGGIDFIAGKRWRDRRQVFAEVPWSLIDVERNQVHRWMMVHAVPAVAFQEAVDDVLAVRKLRSRW